MSAGCCGSQSLRGIAAPNKSASLAQRKRVAVRVKWLGVAGKNRSGVSSSSRRTKRDRRDAYRGFLSLVWVSRPHNHGEDC
ncbi:hypothetical protein ATANTOWER_025635 [Ataeniobius toweri]|uniref:Uncharacterized protein n=1 Tax=Ataeniobius toweri TaxID=208326 RepID=A0ABU7BAA7_9TELE|nr:hypothetical protein [Ataeniobius toweri]